MEKNRRQFAAELPERPNWVLIAEYLAGLGLTDADGNKPTRQTARLTWYDTQGKRRQGKARVVLPVVVPVAAPVVQSDDAAARRLALLGENHKKRSGS